MIQRKFTLLFLLVSLLGFVILPAQQRIDSSFAFQSDPAKQYSLYIPSGYDPASPHTLMLGLHPLNTNRWDAVSWCDTLIVFAETNNLILVCPDGGADGAVNDPIDTAFTTALLDSVQSWYNVDPARFFAMGFSWGGKTTYTYGLLRPQVFCGYLPIGAAITSSELTATMRSNAHDKPVYIVHGASDSPAIRYTPIRQALIDNGAILNSVLMSGVGHTIDFPNRNQILSDAFQWLDSACTAGPPISIDPADTPESQIQVYPSIASRGQEIYIEFSQPIQPNVRIDLFDLSGQEINPIIKPQGNNKMSLSTAHLSTGLYLLKIHQNSQTTTRKISLY